MTAAEERQFHRGKDARRCGEPRQLDDGRASAASRAAFNGGWDEQDSAMRSVERTPAELDASSKVIAQLKDWAKQNLKS